MKVSDLKQEFYDASAKASDLCRQLALSGVGIIWVIKIGAQTSGGLTFTPYMAWCLIGFSGTLLLDFFQYVYKTLIWGRLNDYHWRLTKKNAAEVEVSKYWNYPTTSLFWAKIALCVGSYTMLLIQMSCQLF